MRIFVEGIGLCGPGLEGWLQSRPILTGSENYRWAPTRVPPTELLPANERRRAVQTVKIALAVCAEAFGSTMRDPAQTASVFASSGGDGGTIDQILNVLASSNRELSPTGFHNSVHNAPAGYWSIATGSKAASSSLCCHDDSFTAGLLEAAVQATSDCQAVALVAYDVCYPAPLAYVRSIGAAFAVSFVLSPMPTASAFAQIEMRLGPRADGSVLPSPALEALRQTTPAARSLPLLSALARREVECVTLNYLDDMALVIDITPIPVVDISGAISA